MDLQRGQGRQALLLLPYTLTIGGWWPAKARVKGPHCLRLLSVSLIHSAMNMSPNKKKKKTTHEMAPKMSPRFHQARRKRIEIEKSRPWILLRLDARFQARLKVESSKFWKLNSHQSFR